MTAEEDDGNSGSQHKNITHHKMTEKKNNNYKITFTHQLHS